MYFFKTYFFKTAPGTRWYRLAIAAVAAAVLPGLVGLPADRRPPRPYRKCGTKGIHSWGYWGQELQQMKPDIQRVLGANPPTTDQRPSP